MASDGFIFIEIDGGNDALIIRTDDLSMACYKSETSSMIYLKSMEQGFEVQMNIRDFWNTLLKNMGE